MARDKERDDKMFNCSQEWEIDYVANLYPAHETQVKQFLIRKCHDGTIKYYTHMEVYQLIKKELGYPIPD